MSRLEPRKPKPGFQRFRILVAYDGTHFFGWQRNLSGPTVQGEIEKCLSRIYNQQINVIGSGRTDAGVHAFGQQAHFDAPLDERRSTVLFNAMSRTLPPSISIKGLWTSPPEYHAIWSVTKKIYIYRIVTSPVRSIINHRYSLWVREPLSIEGLNQYSQKLCGTNDFRSFMTAGSPVKSTIRTIHSAHWSEISPTQIEFKICGDGFLKHMVRNIVGTCLRLQRLRLGPEGMTEILGKCDRQAAGPTAPAHGLFLLRVFYPRFLDIQCRKI